MKQEGAYEYRFNQNVFFVSDLYRINADHPSKLKKCQIIMHQKLLQDITLTEANGNIIVKHQDYLISGQYLKFLPLENQLELKDEVLILATSQS